MGSGREIAGKIRVVQHADQYSIEIDGVEFPWMITEDGIKIGAVSFGTFPTVTVTLLASAVEVVHDFSTAPSGSTGRDVRGFGSTPMTIEETDEWLGRSTQPDTTKTKDPSCL